MGDHSDMICEVCTFDKNLVPPTIENLERFSHICVGIPICKWYVEKKRIAELRDMVSK